MSDTRDPHPFEPAGPGDPAEEPTAVLGDDPDADVQVVPASKPRGDDGFGLATGSSSASSTRCSTSSDPRA